MEQYRLKKNIPNVRATSQAAPKGKTSLGYVNLGLPANLNLTEEDELNWVETSFETQTVDAEYSAYGFGVLTKLDVNILKYWEVSKSFSMTRRRHSLSHWQHLLRCTKRITRLYSQLLWIIYLSKRHPSHVNVHFPRVPK